LKSGRIGRIRERRSNKILLHNLSPQYEEVIKFLSLFLLIHLYLRSQFATSSLGYGGRRYLPLVFTEHGVAMLSAILNSKSAILTSIFIVRAFVKMRESLENYRNLTTRVSKIEQKQREDSDILYDVYSIVKHITEQPISLPGKMGFNE